MVRSKVIIVVGNHQAKLLKALVQREIQDEDLSETQRKKLIGVMDQIKKGIQNYKDSKVKY